MTSISHELLADGDIDVMQNEVATGQHFVDVGSDDADR